MKTKTELVEAFAHGTEEYQRGLISLVMQSANFLVFKIKGHSSWSGIGCPWEYVKTQHILVRKGSKTRHEWIMRNTGERRWEGRVSKATLTEALRRSELFKEVYKGDFAPICEECDEEMHYGEGWEGDREVAYYRCDSCGWSEDVNA
jgi:NDP-sugar pyrophosphorylase family protein